MTLSGLRDEARGNNSKICFFENFNRPDHRFGNVRLAMAGVEFRRKWRALARAVGIPDDVKNRNSRDAGDDDEEE